MIGSLEVSLVRAIEKWALKYHIKHKASFKCASKIPIARKDLLFPAAKFIGHPIARRRERME